MRPGSTATSAVQIRFSTRSASRPWTRILPNEVWSNSADALAHGAVLLGAVREPVLAPVAVLVARLHARRARTSSPAPSRRPRRSRRCARRAGRGAASGGRRATVSAWRNGQCMSYRRPERLGRPLVEVAPVALERHEAPDVHLPEVHRRRGRPRSSRPRPGRRRRRPRSPTELKPGRHEVPAEAGRLAEDVAVVGREALRAVEVELDARCR